jgi:uncharacterized membrane protein
MPPLCTAGYGLATGNFKFFLERYFFTPLIVFLLALLLFL